MKKPQFSSLRFRFLLLVLLAVSPALAFLIYAEVTSEASLTRSLATAALLLLGVILTAWLGTGVLLRRLNILLNATNRLAAGDLTVRTGIRQTTEVGQLARAFDEMAEALEQRTRELRHSEEYFRTLIENISDVTLILTEDATIRYVSPSAEHVLGLDSASVLSKKIFEFVHPEDLPKVLDAFAYRMEHAGMAENPIEARVRNSAGEWRVLEVIGNNLLDAPAVKGIVVYARDITARQRAEEDLNRQNAKLAALQQVGLGLTSTLDLRAVLQRVAEMAQGLAGSAHAHIFLYDPARDALELGARHWDARAKSVPLHPRKGGTTHRVAQNGIAEFIEDTETHPAYAGSASADRPGALACLPLKKGAAVLGTLNLGYWHPCVFDSDMRAFLELMANQATIAIHNARLYERVKHEAEELERRVQDLAVVHEISHRVTALDWKQVQQSALGEITNLLNAKRCVFALYDAGQGSATVASVVPTDDPTLGMTFYVADNPVIVQTLKQRDPVVWHDVEPTDDNPILAYFRSQNISTLAIAPLIVKDKPLGWIAIEPGARKLDDNQITLLQTVANEIAAAMDNARLFDNLQRARDELALAYETILEGWSRALDLRDEETEGHTRRVTELTLLLADKMGMGAEELMHIRRGALLHDIGKMGVPDAILRKPGALTDDEWKIMRMHPTYAYEMLLPIAYLHPALDIPYCHHEKWDGTGYPRGLRGEAIPLAARLFAAVDVWDALTSNRPYRPAWERARVIAQIRAQMGAHFDPRVVDVFLEMLGEGG